MFISRIYCYYGYVHAIKVSGPYVETSCVFFCIKNITNAENVGLKKRL